MRENLKTGNQREALLTKSTTVRQVKELTTSFQPGLLEPYTEADMIFSSLTSLNAKCRNYGEVYAVGPLASKCSATCKGVDSAAVGEKSTVLLQTQPWEVPPTSISCELVSQIAGIRVSGSVVRRGQSQYKISFQPTIKGRHQLHIEVEGQNIRGSPCPVTVRLPVEKLGTPILSISGVNGPKGVVVNRKREVVITECYAHCVTIFSPSGEKLRSFGTHGSGKGQFKSPLGVAVDSKENIFVADADNHRIQKFTAQGEFLAVVGDRGSGISSLIILLTLQSMHNGKVYVMDIRNSRVQVLNSDLSYSGTIGKRGSVKGQFNNSQSLTCDDTGNLYMADCDNNRIQVFMAEGEFLRMFGRCGECRGELKSPYGVAIDSSGRVYVSEWWNYRVSVFTSEGQFVTLFGSEGEGPGQFMCPRGLVVDSGVVVYVCDGWNNCVQLF